MVINKLNWFYCFRPNVDQRYLIRKKYMTGETEIKLFVVEKTTTAGSKTRHDQEI